MGQHPLQHQLGVCRNLQRDRSSRHKGCRRQSVGHGALVDTLGRRHRRRQQDVRRQADADSDGQSLGRFAPGRVCAPSLDDTHRDVLRIPHHHAMKGQVATQLWILGDHHAGGHVGAPIERVIARQGQVRQFDPWPG